MTDNLEDHPMSFVMPPLYAIQTPWKPGMPCPELTRCSAAFAADGSSSCRWPLPGTALWYWYSASCWLADLVTHSAIDRPHHLQASCLPTDMTSKEPTSTTLLRRTLICEAAPILLMSSLQREQLKEWLELSLLNDSPNSARRLRQPLSALV